MVAAVPDEMCVPTLHHPPSVRRNVRSHPRTKCACPAPAAVPDEMCVPTLHQPPSVRRNVRSHAFGCLFVVVVGCHWGKTKTGFAGKKTYKNQWRFNIFAFRPHQAPSYSHHMCHLRLFDVEMAHIRPQSHPDDPNLTTSHPKWPKAAPKWPTSP